MTPRTERARPLVDPMLPRQLRHQVRRNQFDHLTQDRTLCAGSAGLVFFHTPAFGRKTSTCRATPFFPSSYGMAVVCDWPHFSAHAKGFHGRTRGGRRETEK